MVDNYLRLDLPRSKDEPVETTQLLALARQGNAEAREELISGNLRLVLGVARRFANRGYEFEDLFQIGTVGLIKAIDKFDSSYNVRFSTYAVPMIIGEIRRFIRDDNPIRVSRALKETAARCWRAKQELVQKLGREPTLSELAAEIGTDVENVATAEQAIQSPISLANPIFQDDDSAIRMEERLAEGNDIDFLEQIVLKEAIRQLTPKERYIIQQRFFNDRTQTEIAKELKLSQVQISRLEKQILLKMKAVLESG